MILDSFLFGRVDVDLVHTANAFGGLKEVELVPREEISTPCGTLHFPAGKRIFFGRVEMRDERIIPVSGGRIHAVA